MREVERERGASKTGTEGKSTQKTDGGEKEGAMHCDRCDSLRTVGQFPIWGRV